MYEVRHCQHEESISGASLRERQDECREDIATAALGIKSHTISKDLDQVKSQWISRIRHHDFLVLNRML
jgi:hypothetical protein